MGDVVQLSKRHGLDPAYKGAFGICCSFHNDPGGYTLLEVHCRFTGELPASINVYVRNPESVVVKKIIDRSEEHGEVVFVVAADPPLKYVHLQRLPGQGDLDQIVCYLTEELTIKSVFDGDKLHKLFSWLGHVKTPWTLFEVA